MAYGCIGRACQQFNEFLLIRGFNGEDIDQRDKLAVGRDRRHTQPRGRVVGVGAWNRPLSAARQTEITAR
jgi:hypothetical protein